MIVNPCRTRIHGRRSEYIYPGERCPGTYNCVSIQERGERYCMAVYSSKGGVNGIVWQCIHPGEG